VLLLHLVLFLQKALIVLFESFYSGFFGFFFQIICSRVNNATAAQKAEIKELMEGNVSALFYGT
jgi:hypothetical protein